MLAACALAQLGAFALAAKTFDEANTSFKVASKSGKLNCSRRNSWTDLVYRLYHGEHLINIEHLTDAPSEVAYARHPAQNLLSPEYEGLALMAWHASQCFKRFMAPRRARASRLTTSVRRLAEHLLCQTLDDLDFQI